MTQMPIDELGLVERLNDEAQRLSGHSLDHGSVDAGIASNLASEAAAAIERLLAGLTAISAIRDSIIGFQNVGWSEHIYPLVAALRDAGFEGVGYDEARKNIGRTIDALAAAEAQRDKLIEALTEIASMTQTDKLLWWQIRARQALQDSKT